MRIVEREQAMFNLTVDEAATLRFRLDFWIGFG